MSLSSNKLLRHTSIYFIGEMLIFAGGFISFPIFTRLLTKEEYGIMNLISITLMLVETLTSLGLRHSTQRFFSEHNKETFGEFYATVIYSSLAFSVLGTLFVILTVKVLSITGQIQDLLLHMFYLSALLIVARVMTKIISSIYRVSENAGVATLIMVLNKYAGMLLSIFFIAVYYYGIWGFYLGLVIGETIITLVAAWLAVKHLGKPHWPSFKLEKLRDMMAYGFPMVLSGFASYILTMSDRYVIAWFETPESVANYSVPYNLCNYVIAAVVTAFQYSLIPIVMNSWNKNNREDVDRQMLRFIKTYALITLPIVFGIVAIGEDLISLLASDKYTNTSGLLVFFILAEVLFGFYTPVIIGLQFQKKTSVQFRMMLIVAVVNIVLNIILVPIFSLKGAAITTLISVLLLLILGARASFRYYRPVIPWKTIGLYSLCSLIMYAVVVLVQTRLHPGMFIDILVGMLVYASAILLIDAEIRKLASSLLKRA